MIELNQDEEQLLKNVGISKEAIAESMTHLINYIEKRLIECNESYSKGKKLIADGDYDRLVEMLTRLYPESEVLATLWSEDAGEIDENLDKFLLAYPMLSISTIKDRCTAIYRNFRDNCESLGRTLHMLGAYKLDGHGVRVVFKNGYLARATSRGRGTVGRDITRHMRIILGDYNENLSHLDLVEIRGEIVLSKENYKKVLKINPLLKSEFYAVSSLIKESATDEEIGYLDFLAYKFLSDETVGESLSSEYTILEDFGFETPTALVFEMDTTKFENTITWLMDEMAAGAEEYPYLTDGVVLNIDSYEHFSNVESKVAVARGGNIALKIGYWQQKIYSAVIRDISLEAGKKRKIPVALIEPTVTETGGEVSRVPLYNLATMYMLEAYPGNIIHFKYGGEAGVVPYDVDNGTVTPMDGFVNEDDGYDEVLLDI